MANPTQQAPPALVPETQLPLKAERLVSLDALRGFNMLWIIGGERIVRAAGKALGAGPDNPFIAQFEHVPWQGLHFYDIIWPLFMFMVGVSIPFSLAKRQGAGVTRRSLYTHTLIRAAILFVLGMIAQGNLLWFDLSKLHPCYSVLHGIAAGYLIATIVAMNCKPRGQAIFLGLSLLLYWALLMWIPVPGFGRGVLTPDGNAAIYIDRLVLGRFQFGENTWFLSYLGFAGSVLLGVLAGELLRSNWSPRAKVVGLLSAGAGLTALGLFWSLWFPIIKLIWTSSYVLVAGGISALLMGLFYLMVDVLGFRRWAFPFVVIGMNSIAVYVATSVFDFRAVGNVFVGHLAQRAGLYGDLLTACAGFAVVWLILYWMYRTKSFVRV
jgi:predicted acyltransferase